jgi:AbrB family looped-hinge helix DNA binding protein
MEEKVSVVTRKGQVTIPVEIRDRLGIKEGDKVAMSLPDPERGEVILRPVRSVAERTFGAVKPRRRPEDWQELRRQFEEGSAAEARSEAEERRGE